LSFDSFREAEQKTSRVRFEPASPQSFKPRAAIWRGEFKERFSKTGRSRKRETIPPQDRFFGDSFADNLNNA
jgi:hypothetical protein